MHRPLVIANWKMNTNLSDAVILTSQIKNVAADLDVDIVLCPPAVWLYPMFEELQKAPQNLSLGVQNIYFSDFGPITGEISAKMVKPMVKFAICGHSERRMLFNETNDLINDKVLACLKNHITPIICVGELKKLHEEKKGKGRPSNVELKSDITSQLEEALRGVDKEEIEKVVIVYEPVWAISRGTQSTRNAASGAYANEVIAKLREVVAQKYGKGRSERVKFLYGGSVDDDNIKEFIFQSEIDGVLVGGASLKAKEFINICREAARE